MTEQELQDIERRLTALRKEIKTLQDAAARGIEQHVPKEMQQLLLLMGAAAVLKRPWLLLLGVGIYLWQKRNASPSP